MVNRTGAAYSSAVHSRFVLVLNPILTTWARQTIASTINPGFIAILDIVRAGGRRFLVVFLVAYTSITFSAGKGAYIRVLAIQIVANTAYAPFVLPS